MSRDSITTACRTMQAECRALAAACEQFLRATDTASRTCGFAVVTPAERAAISSLPPMLSALASAANERIDTLDAVRLMLEQRGAK